MEIYRPRELDWEELAWDHNYKGDYKTMLTNLHHEDRMSMEKIGEKLGVCSSTVSKKMKKLGIKLRPWHNPNCGRGPRI